MKVLLGGYGNIGRAVEAVHLALENSPITELHISDPLLNGEDALKILAQKGSDFDAFINVTGLPSYAFIDLCEEKNIDYIDTGLDLEVGDDRNLFEVFDSMREREYKNRVFLGWGMNPGLVEIIYQSIRPKYKHYCIELEFDTASSRDISLFNTWSPEAYLMEAVQYPVEVFHKGEIVTLPGRGVDFKIPLKIEGEEKFFNVIAHEEVINMALSNDSCLHSAFLYQAPLVMQAHAGKTLSVEPDGSQKEISVRVPDLKGHDTIGVLLFGENDDAAQYVYNKGVHELCMQKYIDSQGQPVNATCWQVAIGVFLALDTRAKVDAGLYTTTDLALEHANEFIEILKSFDFHLNSEQVMLSSEMIQGVKSNWQAYLPHGRAKL